MEECGECLEIGEAEDGATGSEMTERIGQSEGSPGGGKGTDVAGEGIAEEDAGFSPRPALSEEGKLLISEGMKGMSDGEEALAI